MNGTENTPNAEKTAFVLVYVDDTWESFRARAQETAKEFDIDISDLIGEDAEALFLKGACEAIMAGEVVDGQ